MVTRPGAPSFPRSAVSHSGVICSTDLIILPRLAKSGGTLQASACFDVGLGLQVVLDRVFAAAPRIHALAHRVHVRASGIYQHIDRELGSIWTGGVGGETVDVGGGGWG